MEADLRSLTLEAAEAALARRFDIAQRALAERNAAVGGIGKGDMHGKVSDWLSDVARRTVCLTLLAGSGSRWQRSLAEARALPESERPGCFDPSFDPGLPRGLYPVRDFLGLPGSSGRVPVAAYSLHAVRNLGRHLVVVRGNEDEIDRGILAPLGIPAQAREFFTQEAPFGKPLGHGDAAWQCRRLWSPADYVVTNFGGDANSRHTVLTSLLVMDALAALGEGVDLLIPAAHIQDPAYPIGLDSSGLPRVFGHAKLQGQKAGPTVAGYTNVGVRVYRAKALLAKVEAFRSLHWTPGTGYSIPGNDPAGHEFALDNIDAELAREGRVRIIAICRAAELTPAKALSDIPAFERAIESVTAEDRMRGLRD